MTESAAPGSVERHRRFGHKHYRRRVAVDGSVRFRFVEGRPIPAAHRSDVSERLDRVMTGEQR